MKTVHGLLLNREDLMDEAKELKMKDIEWKHFKVANNGILLPNDFVIFFDNDGNYKLIKIRKDTFVKS